MSKILLSLDQSLKVTGFAVFSNGELKGYGTWSVNSNQSMGERLVEFIEHLNNVLDKHDIDEIAFEDIQLQMGNVDTFKKLAYIQAIIMYWCEQRSIKYTILSPSHWRKILKDTYSVSWGRKRAEQKEAAINFIKEHFNIDSIDSDAADAVCLGLASVIEQKQNNGAF